MHDPPDRTPKYKEYSVTLDFTQLHGLTLLWPGRLLVSLGTLFMIVVAGCGGSDADHPPTYETTGTVTLDGKPVEGAHVTYRGEGDPVQIAYGTTDAEGHFTLTTFENGDGAVEGNYAVKIMKLEEKTGGAEAGSVPPGGPTAAPPPPKSLIPKQYSSFETSGFTATVTPDGPNVEQFELTK